MLSAKLTGAAIIGVPLIVVAWAVLWQRQRQVFWFSMALIVVGLGYLMATGATDDIARSSVPARCAAAGQLDRYQRRDLIST